MRYFLYARKSTDDRDKQVHSIEDQLAVLRKLATKEGLQIVAEFEERQSAKVPGRPVFNDMLARLGRGEAQGILCWKIDRLARRVRTLRQRRVSTRRYLKLSLRQRRA